MSLAQQFFDANLRAEQIIHIPTMCWDDESWAYEVTEAFDQDFEEIFEAFAMDEAEESSPEVLSQYFIDHKVNGFLVKFATPVPQNVENGSYSFSWSCYTNNWIYADTYEEACSKALVWKEQYIQKQLGS